MGMVFCRGCGKETHESAPTCPHCGAKISIPDGVKGWSWGAFFLNWVWAIGNKTWIGLLVLIPGVGIVVAIILGFKGREWAWKNNQWDSVDHFNRIQKKWSYWAWGVVIVVPVIIGILSSLFTPRLGSVNKQKIAKAQIEMLKDALVVYRLDTGKYPSSQEGIEALVTNNGSGNWMGPYLLKGLPNDPWGNPYNYRNPGEHGEVDIYSYGADNQAGGYGEDADIGNW